MTRRAMLALAGCAAAMRADSASEVWDALAEAVAALSRDSATEFLAVFDKTMTGYGDLSAQVTGLLAAVEVQAFIAPVSNEGDDRVRTLQLDWEFNLRSRDDTGRSTRRRETVKCRFEKRGKKWQIVAFEPLALFAPPAL